MQFPSVPLAIVLAFASLVLGDTHASCTCHNGDSYNWRITTDACTLYNDAGYQWGGTAYNTTEGRCVATDSGAIGGDEWTAACKSIAVSGFQCSSGTGTCYANADDVNGWC